jgi:hypothetical protein
METWAAYVAIDDAYADLIPDHGHALEDFSGLLAGLQEFDEALLQERHLLSVAAETGVLAQWCQVLARPHQEVLPWWLNGTLEEAAREVHQAARRAQMSETVWRRLGRQGV